MAPPATAAPRVAIIRDFSTDGQWGKDVLNRISELVLEAAPNADIQHYHPIDGGPVPESSEFDLVILTGGTYDLTGPVLDPWVAKMLDWIRSTAANNPKTKVLGICWGHQFTSFAMGGKIAYREAGPLIGVEDIPLTTRGQEFFGGLDVLALHKFHKRIVAERPRGFQPLAEREEIFLSDTGQFLTFQGHPEMTSSISHQLVNRDNNSYVPSSAPEGVSREHKNIDLRHDGELVFSRIMRWGLESQVE